MPEIPVAKRRHRGFARLRGSQDGTTAIEMALLLPVFLSLLLGIEEFGRALWTQSALQYAVEAASRCAAITTTTCPDAGTTQTYAANNALGLSLASSVFTYTASASCGITGYASGSQVTASYAFQPVVPQLIAGLSVNLGAKACHP